MHLLILNSKFISSKNVKIHIVQSECWQNGTFAALIIYNVGKANESLNQRMQILLRDPYTIYCQVIMLVTYNFLQVI